MGPAREHSLLGWQLEPEDISDSSRHLCFGDLKFSWFTRGLGNRRVFCCTACSVQCSHWCLGVTLQLCPSGLLLVDQCQSTHVVWSHLHPSGSGPCHEGAVPVGVRRELLGSAEAAMPFTGHSLSLMRTGWGSCAGGTTEYYGYF